MKTDTIAAIATGLSNAGISIIRISGEEAFHIIDKIYQSKSGDKKISNQQTHTVHYGYIVDEDEVIDEVMIVIMRAPKSYTTEDCIEIDCHGGLIVTKRILETVVKYGARLAEPGEFTKRAFLNGRIDLSQAEAVIDLIDAKNKLAAENSIKQLKGDVYRIIKKIRESLLYDLAYIEAALDDPEHMSLEGFSDVLREHINDNSRIIDQLLLSADNGRMLREGIQTVILGKPNAGKSTIMNLFVGTEKSIVTEIAGTTRDVVEEIIQINGICLKICDTAGVRKTEDIVEKIGVERTRKAAKEADLIIYVADSSEYLDDNDYEIIEFIKNKKAIVLLNKSDLDMKISSQELELLTKKEVLLVSAINKIGIQELEDCITKMFFHNELKFNDEIMITNVRQKAALKEASDSLQQVIKSLDNQMPEDFLSIDLMNCYEILGTMIGEAVNDDLIHTIFQKFCMGK